MSKKHISIAIILIVLIIILSELHTSWTNQQIQNDRYEAEEKFRYEAEEALKNLFKDVPSDYPTTDPKIPEWRSQLSKAKKRPLNPDEDNFISFIKEETTENQANKEKD